MFNRDQWLGVLAAHNNRSLTVSEHILLLADLVGLGFVGAWAGSVDCLSTVHITERENGEMSSLHDRHLSDRVNSRVTQR